METPIAAKLCEARTRSWLAFVTATSVLIGDFAVSWWTPGYQWYRFVLAGVGAIVLFWLCRWDPRALGLVLRPVQGYRYWAKAGLAIGGLVFGFSIFVFAGAQVVGYPIPLPALLPKKAVSFAFFACVQIPLVEEVLYRLVLCIPLVALVGPRSTIIAGGIVFAALHFVYGNPGPDNFIAGFFLCWAYIKSGSLIVPMLFHCVGNSFVVVLQLTNWYWMQ
jgi:membrane protease YdiL (CAAX protease family)